MPLILSGVIGLAAVFGRKGIMLRGLEIVTAFTLGAMALYFFVGRADESSKFIEALSKGYKGAVEPFLNVK